LPVPAAARSAGPVLASRRVRPGRPRLVPDLLTASPPAATPLAVRLLTTSPLAALLAARLLAARLLATRLLAARQLAPCGLLPGAVRGKQAARLPGRRLGPALL
jgi:hypothetical protein